MDCQAPNSKKEPDGPKCGKKAEECPEYGFACTRHRQTPEAIAARSSGASKGGRPPAGHNVANRSAYTGGDVEVEPAIDALEKLSDAQRSGLQAILEFGEVSAAARKLGTDESDLQAWVDEDADFQKALDLLRPYRGQRLIDYLGLGAAIAARRLTVIVGQSKDSEQVIRTSRVLLRAFERIANVGISEELDILRAQVEKLVEEKAQETQQ